MKPANASAYGHKPLASSSSLGAIQEQFPTLLLVRKLAVGPRVLGVA
jgi:hypothetical protein